MLLTTRLNIGQPTAAQGLELDAIAAVVLGGTSLFGGRGSVLRTVGGVIILALINNLIVLIGWPTPTTGLATGGILLVVVAIDAYLRRRTGTQ